MKSAYIARLNLEDDHLLGVAAKIRAQLKALSNTMGSMDLYFLRGNEIRKNDALLWRFGRGAMGRRLAYRIFFYPRLARELKDHDFIYVRYQGSSPLFLYLLSRIKRSNPRMVIMLEIPTYPYDTERVSLRDKILGLVDRWSRSGLKHYVDRIVTFSKETSIFGIRTIQTDNGVDLEKNKVNLAATESNVFRLIGVANLSFWHGYDRVITGLAKYYAHNGEKNVIFTIVGSGGELENLKNLTRSTGMNDHVEFVGPKHGAELDDIYQASHVAVSTLGMHRVNKDTSSLKAREYCARGMIFITGNEEPGFQAGFDFMQLVSADNEPVDIDGVLTFYDTLISKHPDYQQEMRAYAESCLGWGITMMPVVDAMTRLLRDKGNGD